MTDKTFSPTIRMVTTLSTTRIYHPEKSVIGDCDIGEACTIHAPVWIGDGVSIGSHTRIQAFAFIPPGVTIGVGCFIGPHVCFTNDKHPPSPREEWLPTIVEDEVVIGAGAIILPGITLGRGCRIAAGAVVTKDVPPGELSFGAR